MSISNRIKLGVAATRRNIFSREDAILYKNMTLKKLTEMDIDYVDIDWLNEEGLLSNVGDVEVVAKKFKEDKVDALFTPHCNFGCEAAVTMLAREMNLPLLLWGPRDEAPGEDGIRLRDSQCGLFATGKDLQRYNVPFTYMENCRLTDDVFERDMRKFLAAANVVKRMRHLRIGQIDTRPADFLSVISNEGELSEKFGIYIEPLALNELITSMNAILVSRDDEMTRLVAETKERVDFRFEDSEIKKIVALKTAIKEWAEKFKLSAVAIQCWDALQAATGIMPCFANSELTQEGLPVACETDICGAISAVMAQAATPGEPVFFADVTVRHPSNDNAELLWHCGAFPHMLKKENTNAAVSRHYVLPSACPGVNEWQLKDGEISICRFDGIKGEYSVLVATGKSVDGPKTRGSYVWVEFNDWPALERKIVCGPYIHHVAGVYGDIGPVIQEAIRYIPNVRLDSFF